MTPPWQLLLISRYIPRFFFTTVATTAPYPVEGFKGFVFKPKDVDLTTCLPAGKDANLIPGGAL
jgi:hypothetical protein